MRKKPKIFLAVAAAVLSVIAGSGAFALAVPATEKPYTVEENYTVGDKTGVKITARVSKNAAAYDYPGYIDIENQSEIVELRMLPEEEGTAEAEMAVITLTDALDTARSLGVIVATGGGIAKRRTSPLLSAAVSRRHITARPIRSASAR